ncbi:hypothetical protein [Nonomuraea diastatica]|uniref:GH16 domain-containing protein n=1 Tax=Nonomuraea diastatica TaxID=1848329 RepID=A0A4R4WV10_9ACTN|nr:hypothetical protein [Nonomuraea diastatica]TDD21501.1 hypothetical protein E1294_14610 [Nonomuraea diastatica]
MVTRRTTLRASLLAIAVTISTALPGRADPLPSTMPQAGAAPGGSSPCSAGLKPLKKASDEFDKPLAKRWQRYDYARDDFYKSGELVFRPEMVEVKAGRLNLYIRDEPSDVDGDGTLEYPAGAVESTFAVPGASTRRASCVEVRTKGFAANVAGSNVWDQNVFSAVWLHDRPASFDKNPNPELDIQEFFESDKQHMALHTWESPPPPAPGTPASHTQVDNCRTGRSDQTVDPDGMIDDCRTDLAFGDLTTEMHTFGLRREIVETDGREAGLLTFYLDGQPTWTKEVSAGSPFVTEGRHLILSAQGNPPGGPGLSFPKVAEHDWVRTYH